MDPEKDSMSPSKREFQRIMAENLNATDLDKSKINSFSNKAPEAQDSSNALRVLYSNSKNAGAASKKSSRNIPQVGQIFHNFLIVSNLVY